jgi:photosystem II stability/assembly factor-like uncharacterized protein
MNLLRLAPLRWRSLVPAFVLPLFFLYATEVLPAQANWSPSGPDGGDARAFAAVPGQPSHLYLGSTDSWIYESMDAGSSWHRLAMLDGTDDLILDNIVVDAADPQTVFAAAWRLDHPDGGLWVSHDAGHSWTEMQGLHGQSIRSFAQAPSNPKILIAGTLQGVYRSSDEGATWSLISPAGSKEIHEVESLAIDPANPDVIYAGTWHLPWKTSDGGQNWQNIKEGVIDDSDVFSIIIDPVKSNIVYASACSGIYKSENGGKLFKKIQGIPSTARRTRVLMQDPTQPETVYAGTTEGLYKTVNGGKSFKVMTGPEVIVNDIFVDPANSQHVLLAVDRGGVLVSQDGGASFTASNQGFSARKVEALLVDQKNPGRLMAGVVNDKNYGGAFLSIDGGARWQQIADGLDSRDVFALAESADGAVLAGTDHGIFLLDQGADQTPHWVARNVIANTITKASTETVLGKRINIEKQVKDTVRELDGRVTALDLSGEAWLAATSYGLLTSHDLGATWQGSPVMGVTNYLSVAAQGKLMVAARIDGAVISHDSGQTWMPMGIPTMLTRIHRIAFSDDGSLWLGAREGVYFTRDLGKSWMWVHRLPFGDVDDLYYDAHLAKVLVSSRSSDQFFAIDPKTLDWSWHKTGYRLSLIRAAGDRLIAASLFDGVLLEPLNANATPALGAKFDTK